MWLKSEQSAIHYLEKNKMGNLSSIETDNILLAVCALYGENDAQKARNHFYRSAICLEYSVRLFPKTISPYALVRNFCPAILSDNADIIEKYKNFDDTFFKHIGAYFGKCVQAILRNDEAFLEEQIHLLAKATRKRSWEKYYLGSVNAFKGILYKKTDMLDDGLSTLISKQSQLDYLALVADYMHLEATTIAKLAYSKGVASNFEHLSIPKVLLNYNPLEKYEGYDFIPHH